MPWSILYKLQHTKQITLDIVWIDSTTMNIHRHEGGSIKKGSKPLVEEGVDGVQKYM